MSEPVKSAKKPRKPKTNKKAQAPKRISRYLAFVKRVREKLADGSMQYPPDFNPPLTPNQRTRTCYLLQTYGKN